MGKESLKLFGTHAVLSLFIFLFSTMLLSGVKSEFLHWVFTLMYLALFWPLIWVSIVNVGTNDLKREKFVPSKGFIIGAIVQVPAIIAYLLLMVESEASWVWIPRVLLRGWLSPYLKFAIIEGWSDSLMVLFIVLFIVMVGIGYLFGKKRRGKMLKIIEEQSSRRAELSKRDTE